MKKLLSLVLALAGFIPVAEAGTTTMLSPLYGFGPGSDGSIQPPASYPPYPPMTIGSGTAGYQRGYACDPVTGHTVLADPNVGSGGTNPNFQGGVYVIDGITGTVVSTLDTNGIYGGTYPAGALGVADDGAVYMCNAVNTSGTTPFVIYRWASVWQSNVPPSIAFSSTIIPSQRYGVTMGVRGSGAGTQIIIGSKIGSTGTNVIIFTTADGINFTAIPMATDVTTADFTDGIAFGSGNTFWAKTVSGHPLRLMGFNLGTSNATTVASFDANSLPGTANVGPLAIDLNRKLLAGLEVVSITAGPQRVWLYDITATLADATKPPVLLDIKPFSPQNTFATAPNGYMAFGGGKLYAHAINNGLLTFTNDTVTTPAPTFVIQPVASQRMVAGRSASFQALAYPAATYQWKKNGANILNATNATYTIASTALGDTATYTVAVSNNSGNEQTSTDSVLTVINPADLYHLNTVWSAAASSGASYINSSGGSGTPNQRAIAYSALSNELYIVSKAGTTYSIYAISATNVSATPPAVLKQLNTTGISGGALTLVAIAVADDGSIYACNEDNYAPYLGPANWKLYRWANSDPATVPQLVYQGEPIGATSRFRWGDVMAVRGSGTNTQIMIDNFDATARYTAFFTPANSALTSFTNIWFYLSQTAGTTIGRSLEFGVGDTIWQKRQGTALAQSGYDTSQGSPGITTTLGTYSGFPSTVAGVALSLNRNLCAGVNYGSSMHTLDLYDVSDLNAPLTIAQYAFATKNANANYIGQTLIAGNYLFTLDGNNGIMAFKIVAGPPTAPGFAQQPQNMRLIQGGSGTMTVIPDQIVTSYQWSKNGTNLSGATTSSYTLNNALLTDAASFRCIVSNTYGAGTSAVAVVTVTATNATYRLAQKWSVPINGASYLTTSSDPNTPLNRSIAYSALSNQLYIINRTSATEGLSVNVVDPETGNLLYQLNTNGIAPITSSIEPNIILVSMAVAGDGAIYAGNAAVIASSGFIAEFHLYRWADANPNTVPVLVFSGEPSSSSSQFRWGDDLAVRGSGPSTEVILCEGSGARCALLAPTDATLTVFTNAPFTQTYLSGPIGRSLQFGATNTFWWKRKGLALQQLSYNLATQNTTFLGAYSYNFPSTLGGLTMDFDRKLAAGVDFTGTASAPDTLALYEVSDLTSPMFIARYNFATSPVRTNSNFIAQAIFGGNRIYAIDGDNGVVAFDIVGTKSPVTISHIANNLNGTVTINYNGGGGSEFVLLKSSAINVAKDAWNPVLTNSATPGSFTPPMTDPGKAFYSIQSK